MDVDARSPTKEYEYTRDSVYLTNRQRDFYEENGYVIIRKLVDTELIDECKQRFIDICNKKVCPKGLTAMKDVSLKERGFEGEFLISRIQQIYFDDVLSKFVRYKPIIDIVQSIIGPNITCTHSVLINKPPNSTEDSSRHPLHQDIYYIPLRPINSIVASWTAMENVNELNGCLFVVPKSHKTELLPHDYPDVRRNIQGDAIRRLSSIPRLLFEKVKGMLFYGVPDEEKYSTVNLIMEKGDTVFFHPMLLHGSGPNNTKGFRKAVTCQYADTYCNIINLEGDFFKITREEQLKVSQKWGFGENTIENFWKKKSWLVRGLPGNIHSTNNKL